MPLLTKDRVSFGAAFAGPSARQAFRSIRHSFINVSCVHGRTLGLELLDGRCQGAGGGGLVRFRLPFVSAFVPRLRAAGRGSPRQGSASGRSPR